MATATKAIKGFKVVCPMCGDDEATIHIDLNELALCSCDSCGEKFTPAVAVARFTNQLRRWQAVARWIEMAGEALAD